VTGLHVTSNFLDLLVKVLFRVKELFLVFFVLNGWVEGLWFWF
jgi:hypothetical protein